MDGLIEGRMVHFVMPSGKHRPAIIVNAWGGTAFNSGANMQVITDCTNDQPDINAMGGKYGDTLIWATSIPYSEDKEPRTWHWIEKA